MTRARRGAVLVGVAAVQQREADPALAREPFELMADALEAAAEDAGAPGLLAAADLIAAPRGFWDYADPCRALAERFGASGARSLVAEIGVLQTTLFGEAVRAIESGGAEVVCVTGAEAKHRTLRAERAGVPAPSTPRGTRAPDRVLRPQRDILTRLELERGLGMPVTQYALVENALRAAEGQSLARHRDAIAALWSAMSRVAAANPDAWQREEVPAAAIRDAAPDNRMLAFPYTKRHNSQWNVDQAAGLIFCSLDRARRLGIPASRQVHPWAVVESNHMLPLSERRELARSPGFRSAGERAFEHFRLEPRSIALRELYSCFPVAVRLQQRELGLGEEGPTTLTGGMAFAGGPLNNFVLQALVAMARRLRAERAAPGLLTAVSGVLTKQGVSLFGAEPPPGGALLADVSAEAAARTDTVEVVGRAAGPARVASYTVIHDGAAPRSVLCCDLADGRRALVASDDPELAERGESEELCGCEVELAADGALRGVGRRAGAGEGARAR